MAVLPGHPGPDKAPPSIKDFVDMPRQVVESYLAKVVAEQPGRLA